METQSSSCIARSLLRPLALSTTKLSAWKVWFGLAFLPPPAVRRSASCAVGTALRSGASDCEDSPSVIAHRVAIRPDSNWVLIAFESTFSASLLMMPSW